MNIQCPSCGTEIEIDAALQDRVRSEVQTEALEQHQAEIAHVLAEAARDKEESLRAAAEASATRLQAERAAVAQQSAMELEIEKQRLRGEADNAQKLKAAQSELELEKLREDARVAEERSSTLSETVKGLMDELRVMRHAAADAELANRREQAEAEERIRQEVKQGLEHENRLRLADKDMTIESMRKALEEAKRTAEQGSTQRQGELLELDIESNFRDAFRDDDIEAVAKGVNGADIKQVVRTRSGNLCGVIVWETKRTKNWSGSWIPKLKDDLRNARANVAVIVTEVMPKELPRDIGEMDGVWICRPELAVILGSLLRQGLLDVARQRDLQEGVASKAETLYQYVISHEFVNQVESMVETYREMQAQINKERSAFEKIWKQREAQTSRLLKGAAGIVGSMQGHIGQASMPAIKGLELTEIVSGGQQHLRTSTALREVTDEPVHAQQRWGVRPSD